MSSPTKTDVCDVHNGVAVRLVFGEEWVERCKARGKAVSPPP